MMRKGDIEDNISHYNKKLGYTINKPQLLGCILEIDPILKKAYQWKEDYLDFNEDYQHDQAPQKYDELYNQLTEMNINEFKEIVSLLQNWRTEMLNSFIVIEKRRIPNGSIESLMKELKYS